MSKQIRHTGTIERVGQGSVEVRILQGSACASCQAAGLCRSSESKEHVVAVPTGNAASYSVGQQVVIEAPLNTGLKAVWWAYAYPLAVLMVTVTVAAAVGATDVQVAMLGLLSVALAMLSVWLIRERLRRQFVFRIRETLTQ